MRRQKVGDIMKKQMTRAAWIGLAVLVMGVGASSRASADELVVANVPFAFMAGDMQMPAGTYSIKTVQDDPGVLEIASRDGRQNKIVLALASSSPDAPAKAELVFAKIDNQYFLSRILQADGDQYEVVPTPENAAREAAASRAEVQTVR